MSERIQDDDLRKIPGDNLEFLVVGLNHRTAPVEIRERLSLNKDQLPDALSSMNRYGVGGVILSTCNRSEFYTLDTTENGSGTGAEQVKNFLVERFGISLLDVDRYLYVYQGYECIHHLFRVASSLAVSYTHLTLPTKRIV